MPDEPLHAILQPTPLRRAAGLYRPAAVFDFLEGQALRNVVSRQGLHQVLLVGKNEQWDSAELVLLQQLPQLGATLFQATAVRAVNHIDQSIRGLEVIAPVRPDALLATNVPHVQLETLMYQALDIEALSRHDVRNVLLGHLLQDGRLAAIV
eukprot:CAMPEP_0197885860 /NCGR_PEP_ID=MMETSP1439-20131203/15210_1 /TAXON_ID=66791 /ORGANISM="Gonyaulax spinifera, Strain CCMP409" /LENGTH=151 /DNA_ID=CAMNT_0043505613 /DNA_START=210 /DNA_END=665 /DNA_ORIENTATION=-